MCTVISVAIEKGGNGKTTTVVNLATLLAQRGKRVLVVDTDPQANCTYMLTGHKKKENLFKGKGIYELIRTYDMRPASDYVSSTEYDNLYIIPSNLNTQLALREITTLELANATSGNQFFAMRLAEIAESFDYIFIDTAPTRDALTASALVASDYVIIPCKCDDYSLDGMEITYSLAANLSKEEDVDIKVLGVVLTVTEKYALTNYIRQSLIDSDFGQDLFKTEIRKAQFVNDSSALGQPVVITAPKSNPAKDYQNLLDEILARIASRENNK